MGVANATTSGTEGSISEATGTSIFDPVLCELAYRWFSPKGGIVLDPFAGGSVRGIVASHLGRQYIGVELRKEQVEANRLQENVCKDPMPVWHCGDSQDIDKICHDVQSDLVFSCPPYADLEVYSEDPKDLSTMPYDGFIAAYRNIIAKACATLKPDRFACFVVGEVRNKKGNYHNFVGDTVRAFVDAGLNYYNEAILVTSVGSLPIRAGKQMQASRKIGKTHQNVLVFVKGDGKKAAQACGPITIPGDGLISGQDSGDGKATTAST
jgi:DNA modification methylase